MLANWPRTVASVSGEDSWLSASAGAICGCAAVP